MNADTSVISALTALGAVVLTPVATLLAARWQNRTSLDISKQEVAATVVSASRQKWMDELRSAIAAFQAAIGELLYRRSQAEWQNDPELSALQS